MKIIYIIILILYTSILCEALNAPKRQKKAKRKSSGKRSASTTQATIPKELFVELAPSMTLLAARSVDYKSIQKDIDAIGVPRVPGSASHRRVREHIASRFAGSFWTVEEDSFVDTTPLGEKPFNNLIVSEPGIDESTPRLILSAHYDSKYFENDAAFVGAIDSAAPCAMIIDLALWLQPYLAATVDERHLKVQVVFFDGEEAFGAWTETDSLYGARHLAERWHDEYKLKSIDTLILLDLLGAAEPKMHSLSRETDRQFDHLAAIERRLQAMGALYAVAPSSEKPFFKGSSPLPEGIVQDDHTPFQKRGVRALHLIPVPFPVVWHKPSDNLGALHKDTIKSLTAILRVFMAERLHLTLDRIQLSEDL